MTHKIVLLIVIGILSCKGSEKAVVDASSQQACINSILKDDSSLGSVRNHEPETIPLSQSIVNYCASVRALDFRNCPIDFIVAFETHMNAWEKMIPVVERHSSLRGEMHDLFDKIALTQDSVEFNIRLKAIWDTWGEVEKAK